MKLLRFITEDEYKQFKKYSLIPELISDNKQSYYHADNTYGHRSQLSMRPDVIWINDCLRKTISGFRSFSNFVKDSPNKIRFQYAWSDQFTGVGYISLDELKNGFTDFTSSGKDYETSL